jgi:CBS-domain-containing membrane protein
MAVGGGALAVEAYLVWLHRALGAGLAILLMEVLAHAVGEPFAQVPFVTSIVLVMALPEQPAAKPYAVVVGHVLSALAGYAALSLLGPTETASAIAVGAALLLMVAARAVHPPAGINAFLFPTHQLSASWILSPVLAGSLILVAFAVAWRRAESLVVRRWVAPNKTPAE